MIAKAVCDVVGTVAAFIPPPAGTIVSTFMGIVSSILGMSGGEQQKSMSEIMQEVMEKQLRKQYVNEINDKLVGKQDYLKLNQVFLNGYTGGLLEERDYQFMISYFNHLNGIELKGELASFIGRLAKSKEAEVAKETIGLVESYVTLTSMIEVLMHTMKSILEEDPRTQRSAENVGKTIQAARDITKNHLHFLRNPKVENGVAVAHYVPEQHESVETILNNLQVKPANIDEGCYKMVNKHMNKALAVVVPIRGTGVLVGNLANTSSLIGLGKGSMWYLHDQIDTFCGQDSMHDFTGRKIFAWSQDCSPLRIYAFSDGGHMFVNQKWPKNPLWMKKSAECYRYSYYCSRDAFWVTAEDTKWNEGNPEYVWQLTKEKNGDCELVG